MAQPTTAVPALEREVPKQEGPKQEVLKKEENEAKSELGRVKLEAQTAKASEASVQRKLAQARGRRSGLKEGKGRGAASKRGSGTRKGRSTNQLPHYTVHATEQMIRRNVRQNTEPFFNSIEG
jgi:hypothetical protein